jgi:hypothetical protein
VDFYEILYAHDSIEDHLEATFLDLVASVIPKWRAFKFLSRVQRNPLTFEPIGGLG